MIEDKRKIKVAVGMSGGVDSSVAAKILKDQGYEVVGFFMKLWHEEISQNSIRQLADKSQNENSKCQIRENACCDEKALMDARAVAKQLDIPFYIVDARAAFKKYVTDYFINEYINLRTPNPCVVCNQKIKFGWLLDYAKKLDCDYLATGHYARVVCELPSINFQLSNNYQESIINDQNIGVIPDLIGNPWVPGSDRRQPEDDRDVKYHLLKGVDGTRDQSYFLWQLDQKQLSQIIFPLGEMKKSEVRELAKKWQLPVFEKAESREICFIDDSVSEFLKRNLPEDYFKPGKIVDKEDNIIGEHKGLVNYTIGQRKGIEQVSSREYRVSSGKIQDTKKKPLYVIGFSKEKNELVVGGESDLYQNEFEIEDVSIIIPNLKSQISKLRNLTVKIRYKAPEVQCTIKSHNSKFIIHASSSLRAVTPGQSAVFYQGDKLIGGGIIS